MRIGFFGTPDLAARVLADLAKRHEMLFIVTAPDREAGRHRALRPCAAKLCAGDIDAPVLQPESLKGPGFLDELRAFNADIFVVVAYGSLIPRSVFDLPPLGTVNLHPSLLPKYRGAAPIQWAVMNGERETGITVQLINERLDAGDIVVQEALAIGPDMTAGDLADIVCARGADLIDRAMAILAAGNPKPLVQEESKATYCGKIDRGMARIRWDEPAASIHNLVRAMNPKPVAFTEFRGEPLKIFSTALHGGAVGGPPGAIIPEGKKRLLAAAGDGFLEIRSLQPASRKVMDALSFINGFRPAPGERFV